MENVHISFGSFLPICSRARSPYGTNRHRQTDGRTDGRPDNTHNAACSKGRVRENMCVDRLPSFKYAHNNNHRLLRSMKKAEMQECCESVTSTRRSLPSIALVVCIVVGCEQSDQYNRLLTYSVTDNDASIYQSKLTSKIQYKLYLKPKIKTINMYLAAMQTVVEIRRKLRLRSVRQTTAPFSVKVSELWSLLFLLLSSSTKVSSKTRYANMY